MSSTIALITTEGPTAASLVTYLIPVFSVALGVTVLGEPAGLYLLGGAALVLLGVALVQIRRGAIASQSTSLPSSTTNLAI